MCVSNVTTMCHTDHTERSRGVGSDRWCSNRRYKTLSLLGPENRRSKGPWLGIDPLSWAMMGIDALTVSRAGSSRANAGVTKRANVFATSARGGVVRVRFRS